MTRTWHEQCNESMFAFVLEFAKINKNIQRMCIQKFSKMGILTIHTWALRSIEKCLSFIDCKIYYTQTIFILQCKYWMLINRCTYFEKYAVTLPSILYSINFCLRKITRKIFFASRGGGEARERTVLHKMVKLN